MSKKHDFPDFTKQHTLAEQECTLIGFFRFFNKGQRDAIMKLFFELAMQDKRTAPKES